MGKLPTAQQIEQFREQGFLSPLRIMSGEEAGLGALPLAAVEAKYPDRFNAEILYQGARRKRAS